MEKLALTKFQMMPVIFLSNNIGKTQLIILDSWSNQNDKYNSSNISVLFEKQFKPLFSLTQGIDIVQLTISPGTLNVVYRFSIPYEKLGDYTKVTVKFMQENELEKLLDNSYDGGVN